MQQKNQCSRTRTECFANKKMQQFTMQQFTVQQKKNCFIVQQKNMVLQCLYIKTEKQKTNINNCLKIVRFHNCKIEQTK